MIKVIKKVSKKELEDFIYDIDLNDPKLYEEANSNNSIGLFQLEGNTCKRVSKKINPNNFEELLAVSSIARPGTIDFLDNYVNGKNGSPPNYPKKMLNILKDTYGTVIFQEQVMQIFNEIGGFTLTEAEEIRNLMKKLSRKEKKEEDIKKWDIAVKKFTEGCLKNDINEKEAIKITEDIRLASNYLFNRSHACSYNLISICCLFFSVYFRKYFYTSLLCYEEDTDELLKKIIEIKNHDIDILPPEINNSKENFSILDDKIYFGLSNIKGVGQRATEKILNNRPYKDFFDFYKKTKSLQVNKRVVEKLIKGGVFDKIESVDRKILLNIFTDFKENLPNTREPDIFYQEAYNKYKYSKGVTEDELVEFEKDSLGFNCFFSKFTVSNVIKNLEKDNGKIYYYIKEVTKNPRRIPLLVNSVRKIVDKNNMEMLFIDASDINNIDVSLPLFGSMYKYISTEIIPGEIYYFLLHKRNNQVMFYSSRKITGVKNNILVKKIS